MTYFGRPDGELSIDQLRYHGLLPATQPRKDTMSTLTTTLKCSCCPVIFRGEIVSSFEMHKDDPALEETMNATGCPECGAPMYKVDTLDDDAAAGQIAAGTRETRARRIAAAWGYRLFRDNCPEHHFAVDNLHADATGNDAAYALAESEDLEQVLGWVLDGCDQEALIKAWEYYGGGGSDDDWKPAEAAR